MLISSGLFYSAGCITLVTRSAHRRLDKQKKIGINYKLPDLIYEYLPYTYGAISIFILLVTKNSLMQFCAFTLIVLAVRNLLCRHNNRNRSAKLF